MRYAIAGALACATGPDNSSPTHQVAAADSSATCPTEAAQPVVLTRASGGSITDAAGNTWTLTSDGNVRENETDVPGGAGTSALTYSGGVI